MSKITCTGQSGKQYSYVYYDIRNGMPSFPDIGGNYVFIKEDNYGNKSPIYFGITNSLADRFDNHHAMPCIKRNGATHMGVHSNPYEASRRDEEKDLLAYHSTSCNIQNN